MHVMIFAWLSPAFAFMLLLTSPWRACAARVTVVGSICLSVCLLINISPLKSLLDITYSAGNGVCVDFSENPYS